MAKVDVGDMAPEFELPGTGGRTYRLADYRGRKVVLAFYPGDFTAVCTKQFCSYRDEGDRLDGIGAEVLGHLAAGRSTRTSASPRRRS